MFTGLIETVCRVRSVRPLAGGAMLDIVPGEPAEQVKVGDSVAINGVCLTVADVTNGAVRFDLSEETLAKSTLGRLRAGSPVNVETALKADGRFGGHIVQGHVDGVGRIRAIERKGDFADVRFAADAELVAKMVPKGAVAVDGISLTIADMGKEWFSAAIIPVTLAKTTLGKAKVGDQVNIETDIISKIVRNRLSRMLSAEKGLTVDKLRQMGFA